MQVKIPSFRPDLSREVDLIEEIARIDGFDKFDTVFPVAELRPVKITARQSIIKKAREVLCCTGFSETIHYSFIERVHAEEFKMAFAAEQDQVLTLKNPLSSENDTMRTSLLPGSVEDGRAQFKQGAKTTQTF